MKDLQGFRFSAQTLCPDIYDGIVLRLGGRSNNRRLQQMYNSRTHILCDERKIRITHLHFTVNWSDND